MATTRFQTRKQKILEQLGVPDTDYHDLSPKGSVDEPIRGLIRDINGIEGLVTTSSCSGRISVFLEGRRADAGLVEQPQESTIAGPGGKGGGGSWLFISHDPVHVPETERVDEEFMSTFKLKARDSRDGTAPPVSVRFIHVKFEPMILHISTATLEDSQRVLTAALSAGFRESGAVSLHPSKSGELNPIVAVRSTGYSFDAIVGYQNDAGENVAMVDEEYLRMLVAIANERFSINSERIGRFQTALLEQYANSSNPNHEIEWEDAETRKRRKREEGLARQRALREEKEAGGVRSSNSAQESEGSEVINSSNEISI